MSGPPAPVPVNDRLYDKLLKPLVESYYATLQSLAALPVDESTRITRSWRLGRLSALEQEGDRIAGVLAVATPDWAAMRELAVAR